MRPTTAVLFPKLVASTSINAPLSPTANIYTCCSILKFGLKLALRGDLIARLLWAALTHHNNFTA